MEIKELDDASQRLIMHDNAEELNVLSRSSSQLLQAPARYPVKPPDAWM